LLSSRLGLTKVLDTKRIFYFSKAKVFLFIIYLVPLVFLLWFVGSFSVDIPRGDSWSLLSLFEKIYSGKASLQDFFAQHNEHRMFFPKIIFAVSAFASKWNIKYQLYLSIFLTIVIFLVIYKISYSQDSQQNKTAFHFVNILSCILLFSVVQHENWLWGFQIAWFLVNTCILLAILVVNFKSHLYPKTRLLISAMLCFVASFSSAHGLLSWLTLIPSIYSMPGKARYRKNRLITWILFFLISFTIYMIDYSKPSHHPNTFFFINHPIVAGNYFLTVLGFPVAGKILAPMFGFILVISFLILSIYCFKNYQSNFTHNAAPWLSIGLYSLMFASVTTIGRAGFGVEQATASRYTTNSILLTVAVTHLLRLFIGSNPEYLPNLSLKFNWNHISKTKGIIWFNGNISLSIFNICILVIVLFSTSFLSYTFLINSAKAVKGGQYERLQRQKGQACLELIYFLDKSVSEYENNCFKAIRPTLADSTTPTMAVTNFAKTLEKTGFREVPKSLTFNTSPDKVYGYFDKPSTTENPLIVNKGSKIRTFGWAILPDKHEPAKLVLLSYGDQRSFFAISTVNSSRPDVAKALHSSRYEKTGWKVNILAKHLPVGETTIKAWVYDPDGKQFVQLVHEPKIKVTKEEPKS
jgi:hypothetical protein